MPKLKKTFTVYQNPKPELVPFPSSLLPSVTFFTLTSNINNSVIY